MLRLESGVSAFRSLDLSNGPIAKSMTLFVFPLFLANLCQTAYHLVDLAIVGNLLGMESLAAVSIAGDITNFLLFFAQGFASASQIILSRYLGANEGGRFVSFARTMLAFMFAIALVASFFSLVFSESMLRAMNTPIESLEGANAYLTTCALGLCFVYGYNAMCSVCRARGDSWHPLLFVVVSSVLNVVLDFVLIAGFSMGVFGAAIATVLSQMVGFCLVFLFLRSSWDGFIAPSEVSFGMWCDKEELKNLVSLGLPMALHHGAILFSKLFVGSFINGYGVEVAAATGIMSRLYSVGQMYGHAVSQGAAVMLGRCFGSGNRKRAVRIIVFSLMATLGIFLICALVLLGFAENIVAMFADEVGVLDKAMEYLPLLYLDYLFISLRAPALALVNGSGSSSLNYLIAFLDAFLGRVGVGLLLGFVFRMGYFGFWLGGTLAGFLPAVVGYVYLASGRWKRKLIR